MTEVQGAGERRAKRMRRFARILALVWAGCWTLLIAAFAYLLVMMCSSVVPFSVVAEPLEKCMAEVSIVFFPIVAILWVSAAIPWRWEAIGGLLLVVEGLLIFTLVGWVELQDTLRWGMPAARELLLLFGAVVLPPSVAGLLFLASWWRSRTSESRQDNGQERR